MIGLRFKNREKQIILKTLESRTYPYIIILIYYIIITIAYLLLVSASPRGPNHLQEQLILGKRKVQDQKQPQVDDKF